MFFNLPFSSSFNVLSKLTLKLFTKTEFSNDSLTPSSTVSDSLVLFFVKCSTKYFLAITLSEILLKLSGVDKESILSYKSLLLDSTLDKDSFN